MKEVVGKVLLFLQLSGKWRCLIFILITLAYTSVAKAQFVTIPDPNFAAYLQSNFPGCMTGNQMDTTCFAVENLQILNVGSSAIQDLTGIQYFDNLQNLDCHDNLLETLPPLPPTITILNINYNFFASLPDLPPNLAQLYCSNNMITSLPPLPSSLNILSCAYNLISSLPPLPSLTYMSASNNILTLLPSLPFSLNNIAVSYNLLDSLPALPPGLHSLVCNNNLLTALPSLPPALLQLKCASNQLQTLPALPSVLSFLGCSENQLATLPDLPSSLDTLSAHDNLITSLPPFPGPSFSCAMDISNNPISCLPQLPDSIGIFFCGTNIQCLPNIPQFFLFNNCDDTLPPICSATSECVPYNISGYAFQDLNNNCFFDVGEPPLAGRVIEVNSGEYYATTNENGYYAFYTGIPGSYQLSQVNPDNTLWGLPCSGNQLNVTIANAQDTFNDRNFPNQIVSFCALPSVDISTFSQRLCDGDNQYSVDYCNRGTLTAFNCVVSIAFDPEIIPLSSSLPWSSALDNVYAFDVGTLAPGDCGSFIVTDSVSCNAIIDQTACIRANIFPDTTCEPVSPLWDESDLKVSGTCNVSNDSIIFKVKNTGIGDMLDPQDITIYEDDLLMSVSVFQGNSGDSMIWAIPATGKTYRVEAQQSVNHPGKSFPRSFVELCGTGPYSLNKIIPVMQDDADPWVEIDCHLISASEDPNKKTVQPSGVGPLHLVTANDDLDYLIQFQNTGSDTAFNVLIIDTLDASHLDVTSIEPGPSSSRYVFSLEGNGVARFALNDIVLPDSNTNEAASHGFVKFKIHQKPGNVPGTVINNSASIYFDYNDPIKTDTAFVTIADDDSIFQVQVYTLSLTNELEITVSPNPFEKYLQLNIVSGFSRKNFKVILIDVLGREVFRSAVVHDSSFMLFPRLEESGIYFFRIYDDEELIGTGKLLRK